MFKVSEAGRVSCITMNSNVFVAASVRTMVPLAVNILSSQELDTKLRLWTNETMLAAMNEVTSDTTGWKCAAL